MMAFQERQFSAIGDPNGTRTRVFAVKGDYRLNSMARPDVRHWFRTLHINGLRVRGDGFTPFRTLSHMTPTTSNLAHGKELRDVRL